MFKRPVTFTVRGKGQFPIDMLRYDACHPKAQTDVRKIESSVARMDFALQTNEITLVGSTSPTIERWKSFGWEVIS